MQHLVVKSATSRGLENNIGWYRNAAGFHYNHRFGFGLLNAQNIVENALQHVNLDKQDSCEIQDKM